MPRRRCSATGPPPRSEGKLFFTKIGNARCSVWRWRYLKRAISSEDFRHNLINAIAAWEKDACAGEATWDYYEQYAKALIEILEQRGIQAGELERQMMLNEASK
jgi:hypothetical protein